MGVMQTILRHLRDPWGIPGVIWKNIAFPFSPLGKEKRYDRRLGIDTCGFIDPSKLGISEGAQKESNSYHGTPPGLAKFLIRRVAPYAKDFTFLDVGSGKGRVLLIASRFPFSRVVGFEHSDRMNEIAARNVRQFAKHYPDMVPVEIVGGDATRLPLPDGPLVVFLFNPFGAGLMRGFAESLQNSYRRNPRKIIVIYYNATFPEELAQCGMFSTHEVIATPADPTDRYSDLKLPTIIFETLDH